MTTPTMDKMLKVYKDAAEIERLKCGCPEKGTVVQFDSLFLVGDEHFRSPSL